MYHSPSILTAGISGPVMGKSPSSSSPKVPFGFYDYGTFPKGSNTRRRHSIHFSPRKAESWWWPCSLANILGNIHWLHWCPWRIEYTTFDLVVRLETLEGKQRFFLDIADKSGVWNFYRPFFFVLFLPWLHFNFYFYFNFFMHVN